MSRNIIGTSSAMMTNPSGAHHDYDQMKDACKRFITQSNKEPPVAARSDKFHGPSSDTTTLHSNKFIVINVSGAVFKTRTETLSRFPDTLLGSPHDRAKYYDERSGEFFFDRHSPTFPSILYYYQSHGQIHKPTSVSANLFREELHFFKIKTDEWDDRLSARWSTPNTDHDPSYQYNGVGRPATRHYSTGKPPLIRRETAPAMTTAAPRSEVVSSNGETHPSTRSHSQTSAHAPSCKDGLLVPIARSYPDKGAHKSLKQKAYDLLENPETSTPARIFSWISMGLITFSVGTFVAETLPDYKEDLSKMWWTTMTGIVFFSLETACIAFFTIELIGRFLTCPNKSKFAKNKLNIIDLISILPYYMELFIPKDADKETGNMDSIGSLLVLRVLRLFRVLRIFKLSRHSKNMIAFGLALHASLAELLMLGLFLLIDVIIFASAVYYAEMDVEGTKFDSIPSSCWWAIVTVTTLGYGDIFPTTWVGKLLGTLCVLSGILVIAFQMPIMVAKFTWTFMQNTSDTPPPQDLEEEEEEEERPYFHDSKTLDQLKEEQADQLSNSSTHGPENCRT